MNDLKHALNVTDVVCWRSVGLFTGVSVCAQVCLHVNRIVIFTVYSSTALFEFC